MTYQIQQQKKTKYINKERAIQTSKITQFKVNMAQ